MEFSAKWSQGVGGIQTTCLVNMEKGVHKPEE